jgi:hypothetical protein
MLKNHAGTQMSENLQLKCNLTPEVMGLLTFSLAQASDQLRCC